MNNNISVDEILNFVPRSNIKTLKGHVYIFSDYKIFLYMMKKFPQLHQLSLTMGEGSPAQLNHHILPQLFPYIFKMDCYSINNIVMDQSILIQTVENYWEANSNLGDECLEIDFSDLHSNETPATLDALKEVGKVGSTTTITYPDTNFEWPYLQFIQRNGKFVGHVRFTFSVFNAPYSDSCRLPENFIPETLTHCRNLQTLHMNHCVLSRFVYLRKDFSRNHSIKKLCIKGCVIYDDMLEQLSLLLSEINQLQICDVKQLTREKPLEPNELLGNQDLEINMPYTKIEDIIFGGMDDF